MSFFGAAHLVTHPAGEAAAAYPVHVAVRVLLLHYLLTASGAPAAGSWAAFRELPGGLFYAASFAARAEAPLARAFTAGPGGLEAFARAARSAGGQPLELADAAWSFAALPRVPIAALVWVGDDELPGEARLLFDLAPATTCRRRTWPASAASWRGGSLPADVVPPR